MSTKVNGGASLQLTVLGAHRYPSELSTDGCHGQMSRAGSAGLTGSGFLRTLSVRGHDFTRPGPRARGHMADRQDHKAGNRRDIRRSGYALINQDRRSVKPSAQPTQVRTLHLPLPAETAPGLRLPRLAGRLLVVPPCCIMCRRGVWCRSGCGHMADGSGAGGAVHGTAGSGGRRARSSGSVALRTAGGPSYVSGRPGRDGGGPRRELP